MDPERTRDDSDDDRSLAESERENPCDVTPANIERQLVILGRQKVIKTPRRKKSTGTKPHEPSTPRK